MYFRLVILPWPLRVFYSLHELVVTWATVLAVLVLLSLFIFVCRSGRKNASISAAILLTVFLIPVLLTDHRGGALLAERFLYLPSVGFCLLAGNLVDIWPGSRRVLISGLGVLIALMFFGTGIQNRVWKNEIILFTELTRVSPMVPGGYYNLGNAFAEEGRHLEAVTAYQRTVQIDPGHHRAFFNMGNSFRNLGRYRDAVDAYNEALRIDPTLEAVYVNLGVAYMEEGEPKRSIGVYLRGLHYAPEDVRLHIGLVLAYMETGDRSAAEGHYRLLEGKDPELAGLLKKLLEDDVGGK
jgi:tetratricopeptide (TPR) repeat protein